MLRGRSTSFQGGSVSSCARSTFSGNSPAIENMRGEFRVNASLAVELSLDSINPVPGLCDAVDSNSDWDSGSVESEIVVPGGL